jgi:drug/metabolite transporter (DMT)-like permease
LAWVIELLSVDVAVLNFAERHWYLAGIFTVIALKSNARDRGLPCSSKDRKKSGRRIRKRPRIPRMFSRHAKGLMITASGVLIISPDGLLTRLIETDHWNMIFWRSLLLSFGMWLMVSLTKPNRVWQQYRTVHGPGLFMVAAYSLGTVSFIFAITHTSVANTLIILSSTPLFAALISRVILGEKIQPRTMLAILMVAVGIAVIASGSVNGDVATQAGLMGDLAAIAGSFFLACGLTFVRRFPRTSTFAAISCGGLLTALLMLPLASPLAISQADLGYLLIMGLYVVPIGTALLYIGPRYIPAAEVGLLLLLESILGPVWVWLALAERPGVYTLAGGAIVLLTLAINTVWALRHARP